MIKNLLALRWSVRPIPDASRPMRRRSFYHFAGVVQMHSTLVAGRCFPQRWVAGRQFHSVNFKKILKFFKLLTALTNAGCISTWTCSTLATKKPPSSIRARCGWGGVAWPAAIVNVDNAGETFPMGGTMPSSNASTEACDVLVTDTWFSISRNQL